MLRQRRVFLARQANPLIAIERHRWILRLYGLHHIVQRQSKDGDETRGWKNHRRKIDRDGGGEQPSTLLASSSSSPSVIYRLGPVSANGTRPVDDIVCRTRSHAKSKSQRAATIYLPSSSFFLSYLFCFVNFLSGSASFI